MLCAGQPITRYVYYVCLLCVSLCKVYICMFIRGHVYMSVHLRVCTHAYVCVRMYATACENVLSLFVQS